MMLELCIDSSSGAAVAIVQDGITLARVSEADTRRHAESLAPLVRQAADQAGVAQFLGDPGAGWKRINVGTGPAPFTGLRAGLVTAQVFGRALGVPVYGVSSLEIIGRGALDVLPETEQVIVATDARRHEVYWARYGSAGPNAVTVIDEPQVASPADLATQLRKSPAVIVGPGSPLVRAEFEAVVGPTDSADPSVLSRLVTSRLAANPDEELPVEPLYLRRPDVNRAAGTP